MELATLSTEALGKVCDELDAYSIAHLWLSGNALLMNKLSKQSVTRFDLTYRYNMPMAWPKLIANFFALRSLRIVSSDFEHDLPVRKVDLLDIPHGVKDIYFSFYNSELIWMGIESLVDEPRLDPDWSPRNRSERTPAIFPVGDHLKTLESLYINGIAALPDAFVKSLPKTLLSLCLPQQNLIQPSVISAHLPYLTKLQLMFIPKEAPLQWPSVQSLIFARAGEAFDVRSFSELESSLPPSVIELAASMFVPESPLSNGPNLRNLTSLEFDVSRDIAADFQASLLQSSLMHTLIHLTMHMDWSWPEASLYALPRGLKTLRRLRGNENYSREALLALPPGLTCLHMDLVPPWICNKAAFDHLSELQVLKVTTIHALPLACFPPKIRSLRLLHAKLCELSPLPETITRLVVSSILPRDLIHATRLTTLKLCPSALEISVALVKALPRSLTHFTMVSPSFEIPDISRYFPQGLTSLILLDDWETDNTPTEERFYHHLPPSLTHLDVCCPTLLSDSAIASLPRGLQTFRAPIRAYDTTGPLASHSLSTLATLPRYLRTLDIHGLERIVDSDLSDLPRTLVKCSLRNATKLTDSCIAFLPRCLRYLSIDALTAISNPNDLPASLNEVYLKNTLEFEPLDIKNAVAGLKPLF